MINPKVAIVIPNWNGQKFLKDCIESLNKVVYKNYQVIVVDNGSSDNSVDFLKNNFPNVIVLESGKNEGFAAACNKGIKYSLNKGVDFALLLNNDTVVAPDFLNKMVEAAKEINVGIVGAKIYYYDDPKKIWFAGGKFIMWRASGQHKYWMKEDNEKLKGVKNTDFITGCAMLIKKEVFESIGFFYEPYFLTVEDLDFCYLAKKHNWKIKVNLDAEIWHRVSFSRQGEFSFSNGYYGTRNRLFFAFERTKNYLSGIVLLFLVIPVRVIQWSLQGRRQMVRGILLGVRDFLKSKLGHF